MGTREGTGHSIDGESDLREASQRFAHRLAAIERCSVEASMRLEEMSLAGTDAL